MGSTKSNGMMEVDNSGIRNCGRGLEAEARLDGGSFGAVYKAKDIFGKFYAVKEIDIGEFLTKSWNSTEKEAFRKLVREVVIMGKLQNKQNFVAYYDAWFKGDLKKKYNLWLRNPETETDHGIQENTSKESGKNFLYIKMELMDMNLGVYLERNPQLFGSVKTTKKVLKEVLTGLQVMHGQNIVHRDLKPNNILLKFIPGETDPVIQIGDFGLSREIEFPTTIPTLKVVKHLYASPEMMRGSKYDFKTDIFSLGLIAVFILSNSNEKELEKLFECIRRGDDVEKIKEFDKVLGGKGLLRTMLSRDEATRPSAELALQRL